MRYLIVVILLFDLVPVYSQPKQEIDLETFAERLFQLQDEEINYEDLYESLLLYYTHPINLNKTDRETLSSLYILSPLQLRQFFEYQSGQGKLLSIYELQAIPSFDMETIRNLLPFVTVIEKADGRSMINRITQEENTYLLLRYTRALGYAPKENDSYSGDANRYYGRFRSSHPGDFSVGLTFEKDPGESLSLNTQKEQFGFDYYSFHFSLQNKGRMKSMILGDYQLQFGQGLVLGSGFGAGKGAETTNSVKRNTLGIRPYASVLESGFFRGGATTLNFGQLSTTLFCSRLKQDAHIIKDTTYADFNQHINTIQTSGYHRTAYELSAKNQITEYSGGFALAYKSSHRLSLGATGLVSYFSYPLQKKPNNYNQYEFSGNRNILGSIYANYNWQNFIFFGEAAMSESGGFGGVGGFIASLSKVIDFSMLLRKYDRNFHSFYSNGFAEGSRNINEEGVYWGLKFHPNRKYQLNVYFDKFNFPWLRYRVDAPSEGFEYLGRFTYKPNRKIQLYVQYREEHKELSLSQTNSNLPQLIPTVKKNYLFNIDYSLGRHFGMRTRVQGSSLRAMSTSHGIALIQDLNISYGKWKISTRYALFDTEDFANAQYVYERDVLYAFSIPAYHGSGVRSYILLQHKPTRTLSIWLRYGGFAYAPDSKQDKSEIKAMIRYKFQ